MNKKHIKLLVVVAVIVLVALFFSFGLQQYLTLEYLKRQQSAFQEFYSNDSVTTVALYLFIYVAVTAFSLPGAAILTLAGGALFGFLVGTIVVSFASTIGATLAFLVARFLLRDAVQQKFGDKIKAINDGIAREGMFYLFTLRLVPLFPFFLINLVMGLTPIKTVQFAGVSQIGMLPGTMVFVNAGTQIVQIESLEGILSPGFLVSFALLGIFPLIAKKVVRFLNSRSNAASSNH